MLLLESKQYCIITFVGMRQFYCATTDYLKRKLPLQNEVIVNAACLNPVNWQAAASCKQIETLPRKLPNLTDDEVTYAADEWKVFEVEDNPHVTNLVPNQRFSHYWRDVFDIETSDKKRSIQYQSRLLPQHLFFLMELVMQSVASLSTKT